MTSFRCAMVLSVMWSTSVAAVEWTELSSAGDVPSERFGHTMVVLDDGSAVMFGGRATTPNYGNDIYTLTVSGTTATWVQLSSAGDVPAGRYGHTTTVLQDGSAVTFGGASCVNNVCVEHNDINTVTVSGTVATWLQLSSAGDVPAGRYGHTVTVLQDGSAVMFGGICDYSCLSDIYTLTVSGTVATWLQLSSAGDVPVGRQSHTMTVLQDGSAVMFGGVGKNDSDSDWQWMNDMHSLTVSGTVATWLQLSSSGDVPVERYGHTLTVLQDGSAVMFGGLSCDGGCMRHNDIYTLTVSGTVATWLQLSSASDVPVERYRHTVTVLHDGSAVMFGGLVHSWWFLNDIYTLSSALTTTIPTIPIIPTLPTAAAVKMTLSVTATAADEEDICETTNLHSGGYTYRSFVDALDGAAVAAVNTTFILSCTDRREDGFMLVTSMPFTDGVTATAFYESVNEASFYLAYEFERQLATTFGVSVSASWSGVVLSVKANDSTTSACAVVLGWTLVAIWSMSPFSITL